MLAEKEGDCRGRRHTSVWSDRATCKQTDPGGRAADTRQQQSAQGGKETVEYS